MEETKCVERSLRERRISGSNLGKKKKWLRGSEEGEKEESK